jgi:transposase InsO family protein
VDKAKERIKKEAVGIQVQQVLAWSGVTRQAVYQHQRRAAARQEMESQICQQVQAIRHRHPRMGTRKLLHELRGWLAEQGFSLGRDRLFTLFRQQGLLLKPPRRAHRTTWAGHWRCPNLFKETTVTHPNQVWASDITYIETEAGFMYLSLTTDVSSRRIMGFDLSDSLSVEGTIRAVSQAIRVAGKEEVKGLIHHSDHGIQYTCGSFRELLEKHQIRSSMGEVGNCYDNALAERVNGILKIEYLLNQCFVSHQEAARAVKEAIWLYNHERPHLALNYGKPQEVYINTLVSSSN